MINTWSDNLMEATLDALKDCWPISPDGCLHLKNSNRSFDTISSENLLAGKLLIQDKNTGTGYLYSTIDELIADSWVVD
jgi:hypothetical protein